MLSLTTVVAVAVSCAVVFIVGAVVGTIVWIRVRQDRLSLAVAQASHGRYGHGLQTFPAETLTSLSREEGTALRQYGQLPYGKPTEWGILASQESLDHSPPEYDGPSHLADKARELRRSFSWSRNLRPSKSLNRPRRLSSLAPLTEASERRSTSPGGGPDPSDGVSISAVEGALELPTETTPRQTPERDEDRSSAEPSSRPISGLWPVVHSREHSSSLFPLMEDGSHDSFGQAGARIRKGSITTQTAGNAPEQPVPPPPCAYPPNRFRLSKNDSMCFSSLSLDTADSSILEDSRRTSAAIDSDFASPALPPCPTFAPYSANDVGRMEYDRRNFVNPAIAPPFLFPSSSQTNEREGLAGDRPGGPRRSLTTFSPSQSMERIAPPPRRSESLSSTSNQPRKETSSMPYMDFNRIPLLSAVGQNAALLPHFSQMQRHSMYGQQSHHDPFYGSQSATHFMHTAHASTKRTSLLHESHLQGQLQSHLQSNFRPPLASALKGGSGPRKGHKRQNCVRISIHPPITFGGPAFSPMVEEPEELEEPEMRRDVSDLTASNISLSSSSVSPLGLQDLQKEQQRIAEVQGDNPANSHASPTRKSKHKPTNSIDGVMGATLSNHDREKEKEKTLPELQTALPNTNATDGNLSRTPSPEKNTPTWAAPHHSNEAPPAHENASPESPRRSAVKGPRSQPSTRSRRNSKRSTGPLEESGTASTSASTSTPPPRSARSQSLQNDTTTTRKSGESHRTRSNAPSPASPSPHESKPERRKDNQTTTPTKTPTRNAARNAATPNSTSTPSSQNVVPIWEDGKSSHRKGTPKSNTNTNTNTNSPTRGSEPVELQDTSPRPPERSKNRAGASASASASASKSAHRTSRQEFITPTKKTVGLGIGPAVTPVSLYDGDGFLRE